MNKKKTKILFMGDSITDGNRYKTKEESWDLNHQMGHSYAYIINGILGSLYPEQNLYFLNRGISGNRIADMYHRIEEDVISLEPDVLSILAGINDGPLDVFDYKATKLDAFENIYRKFLGQIRKQLPETKIVLMEPFVGCAGNRRNDYMEWRPIIEAFARCVRNLSEEFHTVYVPLQKIFDSNMKMQKPEYFMWDGIHPTENGHGLIARQWIACAGSQCIPELFQEPEEKNAYVHCFQFDRKNTLKEIVDYPGIAPYMKFIFDDWLLEQIPREEWGNSLTDIEKHIKETQWGDPFSVIIDQLLDAANTALDLHVNKKKIMLPLWKLSRMQMVGCTDGELQKKSEEYTANPMKKGVATEEVVFLIAPNKISLESKQAEEGIANTKKKPAVIICPGGGYEDVCFTNEGSPIQNFMSKEGYVTFMLNYRVAPNRYPIPQMDLALAILFVRKNAEKYGVDPDDILVMGFSAGGHLCASMGIMHETIKDRVLKELKKDAIIKAIQEDNMFGEISAKPNKICLSYPVINFMQEQHEDSFLNLSGGKEKLRETLSIDEKVCEGYPKTFVWACEDDGLVPASNASRMGRALEEKGLTCEWHIFPEGGHGCGLAKTKSAAKWSDEMITFMKKDTF